MARRPAGDWPLALRLELQHLQGTCKSLIDRIGAFIKAFWGFGARFNLAVGGQKNFRFGMVEESIHVVLSDQVPGKAVHELGGVTMP